MNEIRVVLDAAPCALKKYFSNSVRPRPGKFFFFFFIRRVSGPNRFTRKTFPIFLNSYIKPVMGKLRPAGQMRPA